jgi:hypothetical protein
MSDSVEADIAYLAPDSRINRFFWAPEGRLATGTTQAVRVTVRNARSAPAPFTLDAHGFALVDAPTALGDILDRDAVKAIYEPEVLAIARTLTGADFVLPMGWEVRSSAGRAEMLPPAARPHVDYDTPTANRIAATRYRKARPDGPGYARFILFSLWRCFSPPPQDWPLALCEFDSARDDPEIRSVRIKVDALPQGDALYAAIPGEDEMGASGLFAHNPAHRWWSWPDMTRDEAVLIKFHDSDHDRAWRAIHTAFHDRETPATVPRESIEFRGCAYFTQK